jgi:hypothetical protein
MSELNTLMRNGGRKPVPPKEGEVLTEEEIKARAD